VTDRISVIVATYNRPDALEAWRRHQSEGAATVIVTASPEILVRPFAEMLGADLLLGTRIAFDAQDRVVGALTGANCRGEEKVRRLREAFGPDVRLLAAYGDSAGDHEMLAIADRHALPKPVTHQVYYSLVGRDFEWELMPLGLDQNVGTLVWSPLSGAKLSGKVGRNKPAPESSRAATDASWPVPEDLLYAVTDVLEAVSAETGRSIPQVALAWLLSRPTISGIVIGARNGEQLKDNLQATSLTLTAEQIARLDAASAVRPAYPYWHQRRTFLKRNPPPVG